MNAGRTGSVLVALLQKCRKGRLKQKKKNNRTLLKLAVKLPASSSPKKTTEKNV